jgi:hypothetical protein
MPISPAITLPYPSLVASPPARSTPLPQTSTRMYQMLLSDGPPKVGRSGTGFFASIGRRASLKKPTNPPSPPRVLSKKISQAGPPPPPPARPMQMNSAPAVRGGPRDPPNRMQRAKTISVAVASPPESAPPPPPVSLTRSETTHTRSSIASRRPSLFHRSVAPTPPSLPTGPEFEQQVDKLADLLPHADRAVLAGYLRRAGQDILAIGQYLEDEKNNTLRYD